MDSGVRCSIVWPICPLSQPLRSGAAAGHLDMIMDMKWKIKNTVAMKIKSSTKLQIRRVYWPFETLQGSEHLYCFFLMQGENGAKSWTKTYFCCAIRPEGMRQRKNKPEADAPGIFIYSAIAAGAAGLPRAGRVREYTALPSASTTKMQPTHAL